MNSKYLEKEWWQEWLRSLFPETYGIPEPSWGISLCITERLKTNWYKKDEFIVGMRFNDSDGHAPMITVRVLNHPEICYEGKFNMKEAENEITFIEALVKNEMLPLAVNVPWAAPFIDYFFRK